MRYLSSSSSLNLISSTIRLADLISYVTPSLEETNISSIKSIRILNSP